MSSPKRPINPRKRGRKTKFDAAGKEAVVRAYRERGDLPVEKIANLFGLSRATLYAYVTSAGNEEAPNPEEAGQSSPVEGDNVQHSDCSTDTDSAEVA